MKLFALMLLLAGDGGTTAGPVINRGPARTWSYETETLPGASCFCTLLVGRNTCTCWEGPQLRKTADGGWIYE